MTAQLTTVDAAAQRAKASGDDVVAFVQDLVRLRTHDADGYAAAADAVERRMAELGFDVDRHDVPGPDGTLVPTVLGWLGQRLREPSVVLNAHLDTSPSGDGWSVAPFAGERRGDVVYGRGVVIAKSDIGAYIYAAVAARAAAPDASPTVLVAITCDEGSGGALGPGYLLEELEIRPKRAMTTGFTPIVGVSHNGAVQAIVTVRGVASHQAGTIPECDAMQHAVRIAYAIGKRDAALHEEKCSVIGIHSPTFNVTRFSAGVSFGMGTGIAQLLIDRRVTPDEALDDAVQEVRNVVDSVPHGDGISVEFDLIPPVEPMRPFPEQEPWAALVRSEAGVVLGHEVPAGGIPIYTDARIFALAGIPTVLFGAGQPDLVAAGINGVDENLKVEDIVATTEIVARVVARLLTEE